MIVLWLAAGLLGAQEQPAEPAYYGGGFGTIRRRKRDIVEEIEQLAEPQVIEVLQELPEDDRAGYLERLDRLIDMQVKPVMMDQRSIALAAQMAVNALLSELEAEFDRYMQRLEFERDEDDAITILFLAA